MLGSDVLHELLSVRALDPRRALLAFAARCHLGTPYVWAANGQAGAADCSGLVQRCAQLADIEPFASQFPTKLDLRARDLWGLLEPTDVAHVADLCFYGPPGGPMTHVGLVVRADGTGNVFEVIHARGGSADVDRDEAVHRGHVVVSHVDLTGRAHHLGRKDFRGFRSFGGLS
jgi:hypothetical protein